MYECMDFQLFVLFGTYTHSCTRTHTRTHRMCIINEQVYEIERHGNEWKRDKKERLCVKCC